MDLGFDDDEDFDPEKFLGIKEETLNNNLKLP